MKYEHSMMKIDRKDVGFSIDLTTHQTGITFAEAWQSRSRKKWGRRFIYFIGPETFIKNKLATYAKNERGEKDLVDARMVEKHLNALRAKKGRY